MTTTTALTPFPEGTKLRVTRDYAGGPFPVHAGTEFEVEVYVPADQDDDGIANYQGSSAYGVGDVVVPADAVELVLSAEAMSARTLPSAKDIVRVLGNSAHSIDADDDGFEVDDYDGPNDDGTIEVYGETKDGLRFGFTVSVSAIHLTNH